MIIKVLFLVIAAMIPINSFGSESLFDESSRKVKSDYKYSKCIDGPTKYVENLAYEEICKYGSSCPEKRFEKKIKMYCRESNLSQCFEKKAWKTPNQLLGIQPNTTIALLTQGMSYKKGAKSGHTCAYYD